MGEDPVVDGIPTWGWWLGLAVAGVVARWASERLALPLGALRRRLGFSAATGAAVIALGTASPEVGTNVVAALRDQTGIGLGSMLGANIVSVPAILAVAWIASWRGSGHALREHVLVLDPSAMRVQVLPYLALIGLVAVLTVPAPWRGLQPVDGWIMLGAYLGYVVHAALRDRERRDDDGLPPRALLLGLFALVVLALAAWLIVRSTEGLVAAYGIDPVVAGLFITATMSIAPEAFATWSVARAGEATAASTSVIADNAATISLAFVPLALVGVPIDDLPFYLLNLAAMAVLALVYAAALRWPRRQRGFTLYELLLLVGIYGVYLAVVVAWT